MIFTIHSKKHGDKEVLIDAEDWKRVKQYTWCVSLSRRSVFYVVTNIPIIGEQTKKGHQQYKTVPLHRFIMNCPSDKQVDHINRNTLDDRKKNLRICTLAENLRNKPRFKNNRTGYKGVSFFKGKYLARIKINKKEIYLGWFITPEEAYKAYCKASKKYHGEFGRIS